jgi:hypothetical protein
MKSRGMRPREHMSAGKEPPWKQQQQPAQPPRDARAINKARLEEALARRRLREPGSPS